MVPVEPEIVPVYTPVKWAADATPLQKQEGGTHYKSLAIQPVEYNYKNKLGFCEGSVVKYVTRHADKDGAKDIKKAIHFLQMLLEMEYGITSNIEYQEKATLGGDEPASSGNSG